MKFSTPVVLGWLRNWVPNSFYYLRGRLSNLTFSGTFLVLGMLFLYVPLIVLIIYSFNESRLVTVWAGFSTKWYFEVFKDNQLVRAALLSLRLALATGILATILGIFTAYCLVKYPRFLGRDVFSLAAFAPLVIPEVIIGLGFLLLFVVSKQLLGIPEQRGFLQLLIAHVTLASAFSTVIILSRLRDLDASLEEAAMDLGANRFSTMVKVVLPVISPALFASFCLSFIISLDDVIVASFVAGPGATTLPIYVFSSIRLGVSPKINALATLIILLVTLASIAIYLNTRQAEKRRRIQIARAMAENQKL